MKPAEDKQGKVAFMGGWLEFCWWGGEEKVN